MDKKGRFMNLIIIGAPGSGKGTQAAKICSEFNIAHISTGNMLREAIAKGTPEGKLAREIIDKGNLVDDEVIFKMLNRRVSEDDCANGFLLDGVPRNKSQIEFVEKLGIDKVIFIDVKFGDIIKRLTSRKTCVGCGGTFVESDLKTDDCPRCGKKVHTRDDDKVEVIEKRLDTYVKQTAPVVDFYKAKGKVITINGNQSIEKVYEDISKALKNGNC